MTQADHEQRLTDSWDANAGAWTAAVRGGAIESRRVATDRAIVDAVLATHPHRVLDVGCGEGWLARALATHGCDVLGVDGSAELIDAAQSAGGATYRVLSYAAIISDPDALGESFDAIVCSFSLLGEDLVPLLRALRRKLAPDGSLVIQTVHPWTACGDQPYRDGWRTETFDAFGGSFRESMPWYFRTLESWIATLRAADLRVTDCVEPAHPATGRPLALVLRCQAAGA
jgi:2-polyprenyl-3-methyl-5-hydroxy-6-metoxy-1,4-benzoquinol methylase